MCRHASFDVPPQPRSVPSARAFCRNTLTGWGLRPMLDQTQVVLSELVTSGVLHARTPLRVTISAEAGNLEIAVSDGSPGVPTVRSRRDDLAGDLDALNSSWLAGIVTDDRDPRLNVGAAGSVVGGRGTRSVSYGWRDLAHREGGHADPAVRDPPRHGVPAVVSNLTLDHPTTPTTRELRCPVRTARAVPGSYVDTDGLRRAPHSVGSYVSRSSAPGVGSYTDRDGVRRPTGQGSYTRVER